MLAILSGAAFNQHKVQQTRSQSVATGSCDQFTLSKLKSLLHCMATSGPYALQAQLTSEREMAAWRDLMVDLALHSTIKQDEGSIISYTAKWGNVPVTLDVINGENVFITIGEETETLPDINLANLQKQIRSLVVEHSLWNPFDEHAGNVTDLKQYVALEELTDGLLNNSVIPAGRRTVFNRNCEDIYKALVPVFKKQPSGAIPITLSDHTQLTLTATDSSVTLAINGRGVTLAMSLKTFFEHLRLHIVSEGTYKHAGIHRQISSHYSDLGWHGRLYNKSNPSPAELAPDYKSQPYKTVTEKQPRTMNGKAYFANTKKEIVCRHHGLQDTKDRLGAEDGKGKRDMSVNSTPQSIAAHIPIEIDAECDVLLANAKRYDMVNNDEFGIHLAECFNDMSSKSETLRTLSILSCAHWMTVRLHIKGTADKPVYVVSFVDPYFTNDPVRCETDDLSVLMSHTLELYVNGSTGKVDGLYNEYYGQQAPVSMVLEVDSASLAGTSTMVGKKLSSFPAGPLTATHMYYLLRFNMSDDLAGLLDRFEPIWKNSPKQLIDLLTVELAGVNGIFVALKNGNVEAIKVYEKFLKLIPPSERGKLIELLTARDVNGIPGLYVAMQNVDAKTIKAYGELLKFIPETERHKLVELLIAKRPDGTPGLFMLLQKESTEAVEAYLKLLQLLPKSEYGTFVAQITAKDADSAPTIHKALAAGNSVVARTYNKLVNVISRWRANMARAK